MDICKESEDIPRQVNNCVDSPRQGKDIVQSTLYTLHSTVYMCLFDANNSNIVIRNKKRNLSLQL